jgi:carbamoyltransferase
MEKQIMITTNIVRDQEEVLDLIIEQKQIVGIWQNESEWGPRALGNRSILFDPTNVNAKGIVNAVKRREDYRPFACTVLLEHAHEYFEMLQLPESPYMSFAVECKKKALREIPSLVHADNTCRMQTVTEEQNKNYYNLIKGFGERTGTPILFNTSFNLGGEAIVESLFDAIDTCNRSEINHLYVPEDQNVYIPYEILIDKRPMFRELEKARR